MSDSQPIDVITPKVLGGKYRLDQLLGEGGMGRVFRARNTLLERDVAIKLLRPEFGENEQFRQRFLREARTANKVRHPNIVDVLDVGLDDDGAPYIVQELLDGETLGDLLSRKKKLPVERAIRIMLPVINAVSHAHDVGILHRDLKPENVFLTRVGDKARPKVLDFGISKPLFSTDIDLDATGDGAILGTPAYMSPEQITDVARLDTRSDVWSLGVMLYELISGRLPYPKKSPRALFQALCNEDPTLLSVALPSVSTTVERVVMRCLRRDPASRYATAKELERDLRRCLDGEEPLPTQRLAPLSIAPPSMNGEQRKGPLYATALQEDAADDEASLVQLEGTGEHSIRESARVRRTDPEAQTMTAAPELLAEVSALPPSQSRRSVRPTFVAKPGPKPLSRATIAVGVVIAIAMLGVAVTFGRSGARNGDAPVTPVHASEHTNRPVDPQPTAREVVATTARAAEPTVIAQPQPVADAAVANVAAATSAGTTTTTTTPTTTPGLRRGTAVRATRPIAQTAARDAAAASVIELRTER